MIEGGQPYQPAAGKIEVVEFFAYWCGHCAQFQPMVDAWKRSLPADVRFTYLPLPSGRDDVFARGFFAASDAGALERTHSPLFLAVHQQQSVPKNPDVDELVAYYAQLGLPAKKMQAAMQNPAMLDRLAKAYQFAMRSGVDATPTLVVEGRYRIQAKSLKDTLRVADQLIAQLRAARKPR